MLITQHQLARRPYYYSIRGWLERVYSAADAPGRRLGRSHRPAITRVRPAAVPAHLTEIEHGHDRLADLELALQTLERL